MTLAQDPHKSQLRAAGWHSRGYLPHFDGRALPQFISLHLADSVPSTVIERWKKELDTKNSARDKILLQSRIEKYADQGYGRAFLKDDGKKYRLSAWVVMPNHVHLLATRFEGHTLADIMQAFNPSRRIKQIRLCCEVGHSGCRIILTATYEMRSTTRGRSNIMKTIQ